MNWKMVQKIFKECKELLGNPDVKLVSKDKWDEITEIAIGDNVGMSSDYFKIITVVHEELTLPEVREVTIHEIAHLIFPNKPHYWIECFSCKIAKSKEGFLYYADRSGHSPEELPKREKLIEMTRVKMER